jgi:hypothetical protein
MALHGRTTGGGARKRQSAPPNSLATRTPRLDLPAGKRGTMGLFVSCRRCVNGLGINGLGINGLGINGLGNSHLARL